MTENKKCTHLDSIQDITAKGDVCAECRQLGEPWVSLRMCLTCGHVGCCDSSKNKHATNHFKETNHPIVEGFKTQHQFRWCYIDEATI